MSLKLDRFPNAALFLLLVNAACWSTSTRADDWPQWIGPKRDAVWRETGIIDKFPEGGPKVRWRTPIAAGYTGPAVADGRVYVMDRVLPAGAKTPGEAGVGYWMDAAIFAEAGIPTVNYGPGGAGAHEAVEWVDLDSVVTCATVLVEAARRFMLVPA